MGESILHIFAGEDSEDRAASEAPRNMRERLERHHELFPGNLKLLEPIPADRNSDAIRFKRLRKHLAQNGFEVLIDHDSPESEAQISVKGAFARGNFDRLTVEFYGADERARLAQAASFQQIFQSAGLPLAVTFDGRLHNHRLTRPIRADLCGLSDAQLALAVLGATNKELDDLSLDALCTWMDVTPALDLRGVSSWSAAGFTPAEAQEWGRTPPRSTADSGAPITIDPYCARTWEREGYTRSTRPALRSLTDFPWMRP